MNLCRLSLLCQLARIVYYSCIEFQSYFPQINILAVFHYLMRKQACHRCRTVNNKQILVLFMQKEHTRWVCVCLPYLEIIKFLSCLHYISNQSVASFPDCGNSGLGMRLGKWNFPFCIPCFGTGARMHKSGARVRPGFTVSTKNSNTYCA